MTVKGESRVKRAWRKNREEICAILSGRMPPYLLWPLARWRSPPHRIPVMVLHEIDPQRLEHQLRFLADNNYRTVAADELAHSLRSGERDPRAIALTFDDADSTFWTYAFPLLRRYGFIGILFVISGLVPDDPTGHPNLDDLDAGRADVCQLQLRQQTQPLCTWRELAQMHASGVVDIQSHSLSHYRVSISRRVVDFQHPDFNTYHIFPGALPLSVFDDPASPRRLLRPGAPVFANAPRLAGKRAFRENPDLVRSMTAFVAEHGNEQFFRQEGWREALTRELQKWPANRLGSFETAAETDENMRRELAQSRSQLEQRLGKPVRHFCFPWYRWSRRAVELAGEAGYTSVHCGLNVPHGKSLKGNAPVMVQRIPEEYLCSLPGQRRTAPATIWRQRVRGLQGQPTPEPAEA